MSWSENLSSSIGNYIDNIDNQYDQAGYVNHWEEQADSNAVAAENWLTSLLPDSPDSAAQQSQQASSSDVPASSWYDSASAPSPVLRVASAQSALVGNLYSIPEATESDTLSQQSSPGFVTKTRPPPPPPNTVLKKSPRQIASSRSISPQRRLVKSHTSSSSKDSISLSSSVSSAGSSKNSGTSQKSWSYDNYEQQWTDAEWAEWERSQYANENTNDTTAADFVGNLFSGFNLGASSGNEDTSTQEQPGEENNFVQNLFGQVGATEDSNTQHQAQHQDENTGTGSSNDYNFFENMLQTNSMLSELNPTSFNNNNSTGKRDVNQNGASGDTSDGDTNFLTNMFGLGNTSSNLEPPSSSQELEGASVQPTSNVEASTYVDEQPNFVSNLFGVADLTIDLPDFEIDTNAPEIAEVEESVPVTSSEAQEEANNTSIANVFGLGNFNINVQGDPASASNVDDTSTPIPKINVQSASPVQSLSDMFGLSEFLDDNTFTNTDERRDTLVVPPITQAKSFSTPPPNVQYYQQAWQGGASSSNGLNYNFVESSVRQKSASSTEGTQSFESQQDGWMPNLGKLFDNAQGQYGTQKPALSSNQQGNSSLESNISYRRSSSGTSKGEESYRSSQSFGNEVTWQQMYKRVERFFDGDGDSSPENHHHHHSTTINQVDDDKLKDLERRQQELSQQQELVRNQLELTKLDEQQQLAQILLEQKQLDLQRQNELQAEREELEKRAAEQQQKLLQDQQKQQEEFDRLKNELSDSKTTDLEVKQELLVEKQNIEREQLELEKARMRQDLELKKKQFEEEKKIKEQEFELRKLKMEAELETQKRVQEEKIATAKREQEELQKQISPSASSSAPGDHTKAIHMKKCGRRQRRRQSFN